MTERTVEIAGRSLTQTNVDRELWPSGFTKGDMLDYYAAVAPVLVPHLTGRPLTLRRFPEGVAGPNWYQTNCRGEPDWLRTATVPGRGAAEFRMCVVDDAAGLLWVANLGTVELHPFLWRVDEPFAPDTIVFDLDPEPPADVLAAAEVALRVRKRLAAAGLEPRVKTSGVLGIHVFAAAEGRSGAAAKAYARSVARELEAETPELVTATATRRERRAGKVLVDWLQNDPMRSTVAPYSLRAAPWPLVSTPLTWNEVERARDASQLVFTAEEARGRIARLGDLFAAGV